MPSKPAIRKSAANVAQNQAYLDALSLLSWPTRLLNNHNVDRDSNAFPNSSGRPRLSLNSTSRLIGSPEAAEATGAKAKLSKSAAAQKTEYLRLGALIYGILHRLTTFNRLFLGDLLPRVSQLARNRSAGEAAPDDDDVLGWLGHDAPV